MAASDYPDPDEGTTTEEQAEEKKLDLEVRVDERSACERHIAVTVARSDIEDYFNKEFSELMPTAQVPGFRPGRAPRKLIEARFRKDVAERVKSGLLLASIEQVGESANFSAISEPEFDLDAVELPEEGPMTFEYDLEVRPEFEVPQWKGLKIERPVRDFTAEDVDRAMEAVLAPYGQLVPRPGPAEAGDYIAANLTFTREGKVVSQAEEEVIRIRPVLSFRDGQIEDFEGLMVGVRAGETRQATATLTDDAPNVALRGEEVTATFEVLEVKRLELPELTVDFLQSIGDFESEAELRDVVLDNLDRKLEFHQHQRAREQITAALTVSADWDLPPTLLERQSARELERAALELRRSGFSDEEIQAHENQLRQHSRRSTAKALKEHFILERIAEEEEIADTPDDYASEIALIAAQRGESPRRVRARLEKSGGMDALRNQIIERKVIDLILAHAQFEDVPYEPDVGGATAVDRAAGGGEPESTIPEAKPEGAAAKEAAKETLQEAAVEEGGEAVEETGGEEESAS